MATKYNGDDLIKVFEQSNIEIGNLNLNVIRAWFDTDDEETLNFLNFVCSSVSSENVLTAQEIEEFESIKTPLYGEELERAVERVEEVYPGILDSEKNSIQLKISLEELNQLEEEEERLNNIIDINEKLQVHLLKLKSSLENESAELDFQLETINEELFKSMEKLEKTHKIIHKELIEDCSQLCEFQVSEVPKYLNRMNLDAIKDSEEFDNSIQDIVSKQQNELSYSFDDTQRISKTTSNNDFRGSLKYFENKIFKSYMAFYNAKLEEVSISAAIDYLENFSLKDFLENCEKNSVSAVSIEMKIVEKEDLYKILEQNVKFLSEEPITKMLISKAEKDLYTAQNNLACFSQISEYYMKASSITICALMFFLQEMRTVKSCDKFIRNISSYIRDKLGSSKEITQINLKFMKVYEDFKQKPIELQNKTINSLMKLYNGKTLEEAYMNKKELAKNLKKLQLCHFDQIAEVSEVVEGMYKNKTVKNFLNCGLTSRISVIPSKLQGCLRNIRLNLDKQGFGIKSSIQLMVNTEKSLNSDNLKKNFRLLWIYFLVSPEKFIETIQEIEDEFKAKEIKAVIFKK